MILATTANSQIMYNKVKPVSSESNSFKELRDIPIIDFLVNEEGSMHQGNLNVDIKKNALFESANGTNIARMMIKVNAKSLGNITINFKDVLLDNNTYCLVYTQDRQIVAGPIYQKSINNNQFTIMNLPAAELVLEVIYKDKNDFAMQLNEVSFNSLVNLKKKIKQEKFLSGLYGLNFNNNVIFKNRYQTDCSENITNEGCNVLGASLYDIKHLSKLKSVNDSIFINFNSNRSSCVLYFKQDPCSTDGFPNELRYEGNNGTLINLPSNNCESYVIASRHQVGATYLDRLKIQGQTTWKNQCLARFNWHYKYGFPKHLFNLNACNSDSTIFAQWRSTIDFNEVIDYEGLELFVDNEEADIIILKIIPQLFYKEHHLGWVTLQNYDSYYLSDSLRNQGIAYNLPDEVNNHYVLGSRTGVPPKYYASNDSSKYILSFKFLTNYEDSIRTINGVNLTGYSGTSLISNNYKKQNEQLIEGIVGNTGFYLTVTPLYWLIESKKNYINFNPNLERLADYFKVNGLDGNIETRWDTIYTYSDVNRSNPDIYSYDSVFYYASQDNKEKCPSPIEPNNPCDFDINNFITYSINGSEVCVSIDTIPSSKFPDQNNIPKGYRIYHNFGEQKTLKWETFQDNQDITFPIEFCISKCEMLDLLAIGRDGLDIGIDFYDESGNVYNNIGCDTASIYYEFPTFCELFDVNIQKIDSSGACCTYKIDLTIDYELGNLLDCSANPNIRKLLDSLYFKSSLEPEPFRIQDTDSLVFDTLNGVISFQYTPCPDSIPTNTSFRFYVSNNGTVCEIDSIDIPECICECPTNSENWITALVKRNEYPCSNDECKVNIEVEIPSFNGDCYTHYKIDEDPALKPLPINGMISYTPPCIYRGEAKEIEIVLYANGPFGDSCIITKDIYCPLVDESNICTPYCPEFEWKDSVITMEVPGCSDCEVEISYAWREAICPDSTQELQIYKIETFSSNPSIPDACALCTIDMKDLYQDGIKKLIYDNKPMNFRPRVNEHESPGPNQHCFSTWRVAQNSCWTQIPLGQYGTVENPTPNFALVPCDTSECCMVEVEVCRFRNPFPNISISVLTTWNDLDTCNNQYKSYFDPHTTIEGDPPYQVYHCCSLSQCNNTCEDWLNDLDTTNYKGQWKFIYEDEFIETHFDYKTKLIQTSDELILDIFNSKENEISTINIIDILGRPIFNNSIKLKNGSTRIVINSSNFPSGIYIINTNIDGINKSNHKILIVR